MRQSILCVALTCLFSIFVTRASRAADAPATKPSRPNFVLFIADDMTWNDCGAYGATDVRTPNIDKLRTESLKFDNAFSASPTCTPSRSSIYTGMYPPRHGAHANHSLIKDGTKTLPVYMNELGYRVVLAGKTHIGPRPLFPFEYLKNSNVMPPGKAIDQVLFTDLGVEAIDKMLAEHDKRTPLCLIVAAHSPHVVWLKNKHYDPKAINLPPNFVDTEKTRLARCDYYTDIEQADKEVGQVRDSLKRHGFADNTLFAFTADQGAQFPFAKWNLYDAGIKVPLLVDFPGHTKPNTTTAAMVSLIDFLPTWMQAAGATPPTTDIDGKSFLDVLDGKTDHHLDEIYASHTGDRGMNHAPMRCIRTEQFKYIHNLAPQVEYATHIIKAPGDTGYWESWVEKAKTDANAKKLVDRYEHRVSEELYDLKADPLELNNIAAEPKYAETLKALRDKVNAWRAQQREDPNSAPMPEGAREGRLLYNH